MLNIIKSYLAQPSTWRGLTVLLAMFGFAPTAADAVQQTAQWVIAGIGLWDVLRSGRTWARGGANA